MLSLLFERPSYKFSENRPQSGPREKYCPVHTGRVFWRFPSSRTGRRRFPDSFRSEIACAIIVFYKRIPKKSYRSRESDASAIGGGGTSPRRCPVSRGQRCRGSGRLSREQGARETRAVRRRSSGRASRCVRARGPTAGSASTVGTRSSQWSAADNARHCLSTRASAVAVVVVDRSARRSAFVLFSVVAFAGANLFLFSNFFFFYFLVFRSSKSITIINKSLFRDQLGPFSSVKYKQRRTRSSTVRRTGETKHYT